VILVVLFGVVVDELFDAGLNPADLGGDLVGGGGPDERFRIGVPVLDVGADAVGQGVDRGERGAVDGLFGDGAEPGLDLVDPRGADRGEVERDVRVRVTSRSSTNRMPSDRCERRAAVEF
jgi:hypothetical protein